MRKLLHSADWHLDSPLSGRNEALRQALLEIPQRITALAAAEGCDLILLSGDLFDGPHRPETLQLVQRVLGQWQKPVCIAPGNHDPLVSGSPWLQPGWPENVHIFTATQSIAFPELSLRVFGAPFTGPESPSLLEQFRCDCRENHAVGLFHGDPTQPDSPYNPVTFGQVRESGLDYLALGHIHEGGSFRAGDTLCAWPGCPMGRGFDELGDKGVLLVTLDGPAQARFVSLGLPRFHWLKGSIEELPHLLPAAESPDHYRVDLVGESEPPDIAALTDTFPWLSNLELRDQTTPPLDLWANADSDSLEGLLFRSLRESEADPEVRSLAARICRQLLLGQEVELP